MSLRGPMARGFEHKEVGTHSLHWIPPAVRPAHEEWVTHTTLRGPMARGLYHLGVGEAVTEVSLEWMTGNGSIFPCLISGGGCE